MITGHYDRFDESKNYEAHLFRAGYVLQSAELNEVQTALRTRLKGIGDALFKDGDIVRDARAVVDANTGIVRCESGAVYLRGAVRGIPSATFTIATTGIVAIGIYLSTTAVTEIDDPELRDPASLTRNYQEPGAGRMKIEPSWGYAGDGQSGDFFPVYTVEDGSLTAKEVPPNLDAFTQSLARYDRDSAGGTYVVSGLTVQQSDDLVTGEQVYTVAEGRARVNGFGVEQTTSRRLVYAAAPDTKLIGNEPHISTTVASQRINVDRGPINDIIEVAITAQKTVTITHGGFVGAMDPLPDTSVLQIVSIVQGGKTYVAGVDYQLTAGQVDWSLAGPEPATGSTYTATYRHIQTITPTAVDDDGFTVTGAVVDSLVLVTYRQKLPRFDRLVMTPDGMFTWIKGVSADWNPIVPTVPRDLLVLATVQQNWRVTRTLSNDGVRVVPMQDLAQLNGRIDYMLGLISQQRLESSANLKEAIQKKGLFVDPFLDDTLRDAGVVNDAAIFEGELTLSVTVSKVEIPSADVTVETGMAHTLGVVLQQISQTGFMKVNPYMAFDPLPAAVRLTPAIDRWTDIQTTWASAITQRIVGFAPGWHGANRFWTDTSNTVVLLSSQNAPAEFLRQIQLSFQINGFGAGEVLQSVTFDGIPVTATV
jgi:hypothetical protein